MGDLFVLRRPGAEREKPTLVGPPVVDGGLVAAGGRTAVGSAAVGAIFGARRARSGGNLMGSPPGQFIYLFEGQRHHGTACCYRASDAIALPWLIDRGEDGGGIFSRTSLYVKELV